MLDDLVDGAVGGVFEAADTASSMSQAQDRKGAMFGCLLNLLGLAGLLGCGMMLVLAFIHETKWWLVGAGAALLVSIFGFCYSFYLRQIRPSLEGLE